MGYERWTDRSTADPAALRILHVFRAPVGGLFRHVVDLARSQVARDHAVGLFCDSTTGNGVTEAALAQLADELPLGLHRVPMARNPGLGDIAVVRALSRVRRETGATILHGHGAKGGAYARFMPRPADEPVARIYTPHGGSFHYPPGTPPHHVFMTLERLMARRTEIFTFESAYVAALFDAYVRPSGTRGRVVYNGLSPAEFTPVDTTNATHDLLYVGELRALKGIDTLLDSMALLRADRGRRLTLLAIGAGPDEAALAERARALGLDDAVSFGGARPIAEVLGRARLMVVPSRKESLPYVVLEAAAARQPLVATHVGGIPEIFGPYADRLIPPDDPAALAAAIEAGLDATGEARDAAARALAEHVRARFSLDAMAEGVLAAYAAAAGGALARTTAPTLQSP